MELTFKTILARVLKHEGGYVNNPRDPGGATNKGITQATFDDYLRRHGRWWRSVRNILDAEVEAIYKQQYFDAPGIGQLHPAVAFQVFDAAVHSGPSRAIKWLQEALDVAADGVLGPKTLKAAREHPGPLALIANFLNYRETFLESLPAYSTFGRGWAKRIAQNWEYAKEDLE